MTGPAELEVQQHGNIKTELIIVWKLNAYMEVNNLQLVTHFSKTAILIIMIKYK